MRRGAIWSETLAICAAYAIAIWAVYRFVVEPHARLRSLAAALAFAIVQVAAIVLMLFALFVRRSLAARRAAESAAIRAEVQDALAIEASGQDQLRRLRSLAARSHRDVEQAIDEFAFAVRGRAAERIRVIAKALDVEVIDENERLERMFARAASGDLLERAATIEQLEADAPRLAEGTIPRALTSSDRSRVTAALDMLAAWKRVLPVRNLEPLLQHGEPSIRTRAFRALSYVEHTEGSRTMVVAALRDPDRDVRVAAAEAAARLHVDEAVPQLVANMSDTDAAVAVAAAFALASLPSGTEALERAVTAGHRVAFEALEKATLQRLEFA